MKKYLLTLMSIFIIALSASALALNPHIQSSQEHDWKMTPSSPVVSYTINKITSGTASIYVTNQGPATIWVQTTQGKTCAVVPPYGCSIEFQPSDTPSKVVMHPMTSPHIATGKIYISYSN